MVWTFDSIQLLALSRNQNKKNQGKEKHIPLQLDQVQLQKHLPRYLLLLDEHHDIMCHLVRNLPNRSSWMLPLYMVLSTCTPPQLPPSSNFHLSPHIYIASHKRGLWCSLNFSRYWGSWELERSVHMLDGGKAELLIQLENILCALAARWQLTHKCQLGGTQSSKERHL